MTMMTFELARARRITYWLQATDNCQPNAQTTRTPPQVLEIDSQIDTLAARQDAETDKQLSDALKKAQEQLGPAHARRRARAENDDAEVGMANDE